MAQAKLVISADDQASQALQKISAETTQLGNSAEGAANKMTTINRALSSAKKEAMSLTAQWRALDDTVKNSDYGQNLKAQLDQVLQKAGELQDIKGDVADEIKNIASDTKMWDGAKQGIGILSSSIQGMASVVGMCGGNVEAFTKALNIMKGVEAATNTIIGIGNALQKNSALMVALRALKTNLFTAAETEATAAVVAETAATEAQTVAQEANNAAVLANPYVAVAAAVVGLTVAIVAWVNATDEATEVTEALKEASDGANEANKEGYKTYIKMQVELDTVKKKVDNFNGSLEDEKELVKELNDKYGTSLGYYKSLGEWKAALADVSYYYCKVLEMEAKLQAIVSRMGDAYADMMAGEGDFKAAKAKYEKYQSLVADAQDDLQAYQFMLKNMISVYGGSIKAPKGDGHSHKNKNKNKNKKDDDGSSSSSKKKAKQTKDQQTALEKLNKEIDKYNKLYDSVKDKEGKGLQKATQYEQKIISLEKQKLDYMVKGTDEYGNQLKKLQSYYDEASDEYKKYADLIRGNEVQSLADDLEGLDLGIAEEYDKALSTIRDIISKLREGTSEYDKWQEKFKKMFPMEYWEDRLAHLQIKLKMPGVDVNAVNDEIHDAEKHIQQLKINFGMEAAPETDYEKNINAYQKWLTDVNRANYAAANARTDLDKELASADAKLAQQLRDGLITQEQYNEKSQKLYDEYIDKMGQLSEVVVYDKPNTSMNNIARFWQDEIARFDKMLNENDYDVEARLEVIAQRDQAQEELDKLTKGDPLVIKPIIEPEFKTEGSDWWKQANYDAASQNIGRIVDMYENGLIKSSKEAKRQIAEVNAELIKIGMKPIIIDIQTEGQKALEDIQGYFDNFDDVVISTVDSFGDLIKSIDEGASAWEIFKNAVSAVEQVLSAIQTIMQVVNALTQTSTALTLAKTAATEGSAIAEGEDAIAQQTKMAADAEAVVSSGAKTAAAKAEESAMLDLAAANIFAAHSYIPFAGVGIASGMVAAMMGEMAAVHATAVGLQALAGGGIVQGGTTIGDRVLIRANAGEMVLNQRQQSRLFDLIDHGNVYGDGISTSTVRVKGSDLYLALNNYNKITGKKL